MLSRRCERFVHLWDSLFKPMEQNKMYAMAGKFMAQAGKRGALVEVLLRASNIVSQLPECRAYFVNEDITDETCVFVFETWNDKESHDMSLRNEQVRSLIAEAMPFIKGPPSALSYESLVGME